MAWYMENSQDSNLNSVVIDNLILIDPVLEGRRTMSALICTQAGCFRFMKSRGRLARVPRDRKGKPILPSNIGRAINFWANQNNYGYVTPLDQGIHDVRGAFDVEVSEDHCTIFYYECGGDGIPQGITDPNRNDYNPCTYNMIIDFLHYRKSDCSR